MHADLQPLYPDCRYIASRKIYVRNLLFRCNFGAILALHGDYVTARHLAFDLQHGCESTKVLEDGASPLPHGPFTPTAKQLLYLLANSLPSRCPLGVF